MKLIYVSEFYAESIIYTQVFELLNYYATTDKFDDIIFIAGLKMEKADKSAIRKMLHKNIRIMYYKHYPDYPLLDYSTQHTLKKAFRNISNLSEYVIHVRSLRETHHVYKALKSLGVETKNIMADIRGATYEETVEYSKRNNILKKLKLSLIKKSLKTLTKINYISCISDSLKKYLADKTDDHKIYINSCLATQNFTFSKTVRDNIRKEMAIVNDKPLLVLSTGGNAGWQNTENAVKQLYNSYNVLNLSKSVINHPNVINKFVAYKDVPKYLCAADIAVILREPSVTNKVASPVKFSEYVCCGLPVITNNSIDLIKDYVLNNKCGMVINSMENVSDERLTALLKLNRELLSSTGRKTFGIEVIANQYMNLYKKIV
jgi:glycosyltransferase involved in cell wall biosynthesis